MPWDDDKENFETRPNIGANEKLPADEWNAHVTDQKNHSGRHESGGIDEITVDGLSGDLADAQDPKQAVVNDFVDALVDGGDKVTTTYDSGAGTLTIDTSALDTEEVEDAVDALVSGGPQVTTTYDDAAGSLTISIDAPTQAAFDSHSPRHEDGGSDELDVSGLSGVLADAQTPQTEAVQDIVDGLLSPGANIGLTYDDTNGVLTIDTTALNEEQVEDAVGALVTAGNAITVNYDDPNDTLTIGVNESSLSFYDGTNLTADVNNQLVNTNEVNTDITKYDSIGVLREINDASGKTLIKKAYTKTENVGTTATEIADLGGDTSRIVVHGDDTDTNERFITELYFQNFGSVYVKEDVDVVGSPPTRDYTVNEDSLELSVSSGDVTVLAISERVNDL